MMPPSVSVIITAHNMENHMAACLHSLQQQSLAGLEILCIDDGSEDDTAYVVQAAAETSSVPIRLLRLTSCRGAAAARNTGLRAANGKYVFFLDADDTLYDAISLQTLYEAAEAQQSDVVIGRILRCFPDTDERLPAFFQGYEREYGATTIRRSPELAYNDRVCGKLILRRLLTEQAIYFDETLLIFMEIPFSCRLYMAARSIQSLKKNVYLSYQHARAGRLCLLEKEVDASERLLRVIMDTYDMTCDDFGHCAIFADYLKCYTHESICLFLKYDTSDDEKKLYFMYLCNIIHIIPYVFLPDTLKIAIEKIIHNDIREAYRIMHNDIYHDAILNLKVKNLQYKLNNPINLIHSLYCTIWRKILHIIDYVIGYKI